ncbi:MAG: metallophosphoesterase family protein [Caldilineaceae bacterium]|nr:metallophosphoesterase family protein [Caldilineaceae bacterium]
MGHNRDFRRVKTMMRFAIFSDLHDNRRGMEAVVQHALIQGAERLICLGDVGHERTLYEELRARRIACTYGNWEVSGLQRLPRDLAAWVGNWPALLHVGAAVCCHATPDMPPAAATTHQAVRWMATGQKWSALFPRLHLDQEAVWQAFAWMEAAGVSLAFHGHTHVQMVWQWQPGSAGSSRLRPITGVDVIPVMEGARYLVGVGSAGQPQDGPSPRYAIYDERMQRVHLVEAR